MNLLGKVDAWDNLIRIKSESIVQEEAAELVISTEKVKEYHIKDALRELQKMDSISEISSMIREY